MANLVRVVDRSEKVCPTRALFEVPVSLDALAWNLASPAADLTVRTALSAGDGGVAGGMMARLKNNNDDNDDNNDDK